MSEPRCAYNIGRGHDRRPCPEPPAFVYVNGAYRRLECETHARQTRRFIRYPEHIRLEPLAVTTAPAGKLGEG